MRPRAAFFSGVNGAPVFVAFSTECFFVRALQLLFVNSYVNTQHNRVSTYTALSTPVPTPTPTPIFRLGILELHPTRAVKPIPAHP